MAYSGLGSGIQGDPYVITTVDQYFETCTSDYAGKYLLVANDLDFAAKVNWSHMIYGYLDGGNHVLHNLSMPGDVQALTLRNASQLRNIEIRVIKTVGCIISGWNTLGNVIVENVKIKADLVDPTKTYNYVFDGVFDSTCHINSVTIEGQFSGVFNDVSCVVENIAVKNYITTYFKYFSYFRDTAVFRKSQIYLPLLTSSRNILSDGVYGVVDQIYIKAHKITGTDSRGSLAIIRGTGTTSNILIDGGLWNTTGLLFSVFGTNPTPISNVIFTGDIVNKTNVFTSSANCSNCYYVSNYIHSSTISPISGQNAITSEQLLQTEVFNSWDFTTIWEMGTTGPLLRNVPKTTQYTEGPNFGFNQIIRNSKNSITVSYAYGGDTTGTEGVILDKDLVVVDTFSQTPFTCDLTYDVDQLYTITIRYIATGEIIRSITYNHFYEDSAVTITDVVENVQILDDGVNSSHWVHGSCMHNGYMYGSTRNVSGTLTVTGSICKVSLANITDYSIYPIFPDAAHQTKSWNMDSLVKIGNYLYTIADDNDLTTNNSSIIKFSLVDDTYQVFSITSSGGAGYPSCTDGTFWYFFANGGKIYKVDPAQFVSESQFNSNWSLQSINVDKADYGYTSSFPHTMCADNNYLYVGNGSQASNSYFCVVKYNKTDLSVAGYAITPKMTDDMCQTSTHLFLGIELYTPTNKASYGYGWGAVAIRKSDMRVTALPFLHSTNTDSVSSYASLIFGDYLIDLKTNGYIYALDISDVDNWSVSENIGKRTLKAYKYRLSGTQNYKIINEIFLAESGDFFGFGWASPSYAVRVALTGLNYFKAPECNTNDAISVGLGEMSLSGGLTSTGGKTPTEVGFVVGREQNLSDGVSHVANLETFTTVLTNLSGGLYYWKSYAINAEGTGYGDIKSFNVISETAPIVLTQGATVSGRTVSMSGIIQDDGNSTVIACGVRVGLTSDLSDGVDIPMNSPSTTIVISQSQKRASVYYYAVYAENGEGVSYGNILSYEIFPEESESPDSITVEKSINVKLSWTSPQNDGGSSILGYKIDRYKTSWESICENTASADMEYTDNVPGAGEYKYRVYPITAFGTSSKYIEKTVVASLGVRMYLGNYEIIST